MRRSPGPPRAGCAACSISAARLFTVSARSTTASSMAATPSSGRMPTIDRTSIGDRPAVGEPKPVVEEPVRLVPQILRLERVADQREVLEELQHEIGRGAAAVVEDRRDRRHGQRVEAHPAGAVGLLEHLALRQMRAVDRPDVVEPEEAALEDVRAVAVLAVHPPREVDEQLVEDPAQERGVLPAVDGEHLERRPRLHRRVDVVERPLVRGERAVRVLEPLAAQEHQLVLRERRVDARERDAVEGEIPRGEPRVLPLVRHGHDVERVERPPVRVAPAEPRRGRRRLRRVAVEPARDVVVVELLAPQHPGEGLAQHERLVVRRLRRRQLGVELVRLAEPRRRDRVEVGPRIAAARGRPEPDPQRDRRARLDARLVPERGLRPGGRRRRCRRPRRRGR